ncbi:MAG: enoyl-CoA hydratase [Nitrospiraceae bacterium]|nr:MAG: enoyl-CoA hydratase [Nitrospiraceae bacterium]
MPRFSTLLVESSRGIAHVTLNRPERRNAFDALMADELHEAFEELGGDPSVRGVVLAGAGPAFCAGADLRWMSPDSPVSEARAREDAERLIRMYRAIDECPCPVIGRIHGSAFGGGVGLLAVCDIVVAADDAVFALSEIKLGLVPAVIAPFLLRKAGESFVRRYCLTGEVFSAAAAKQFNLVHDVVAKDGLAKRIDELIEAVLQLAPSASQHAKALFRRILRLPDADRWTVCAQANTEARLSAEAREGLRAFLEKRAPAWAAERTERGEPIAPDHAPRRA